MRAGNDRPCPVSAAVVSTAPRHRVMLVLAHRAPALLPLEGVFGDADGRTNMKRTFRNRIWLSAVVVLGLVALPAVAQKGKEEPGRATVALYRVAPGLHLDFLKWMAQREAVDREVGAPATQWYAHTDGDAWDFVSITPQLDAAAQAELDKKVDAAAKKKGLTVGMKSALEFRKFISWHTDTAVRGPMTAQALVDDASK
jgi:hypothetical protein